MKQKNALNWPKKMYFFLALCCFSNFVFSDAANSSDIAQDIVTPSSEAKQEQTQSGKWWEFILKGRPQKSKQISLAEPKKTTIQEKNPWTQDENGYEINFNNVSIIEVIRTISKMTHLNFIFAEEELTFNVTIVSSGPTSLANLISSLVQVLQVNKFTLSEEGNAFVIHPIGDMNSPAKFVLPNEHIPFETALITKAFSLNNIMPSYILEIIKPMLSPAALVEASDATHHLIITDTPSNIASLQKLVEFLDSPNESAQIGVYKVNNFYATSLTVLADKILQALPEKADVLLIPQETKETIIIVASPYLVKKTLNLLKQLDQTSTGAQRQQKQINFENIFIYAPKFRSYEAVLGALKTINTNLEELGSAYSDLKEVIDSAHWIQDISAFLFMGDPENISKLQAILKDIDSTSSDAYPSSTIIFTYDPQYITTEDLTTALQNISVNLKTLKNASPSLIHMIESIHTIPKTESVIFVGEKVALLQLQEILKAIDIDVSNIPVVKSPNFTFLVYDLKFINFEDLKQSFMEITHTISKIDDPDKTLIETLNSMHYIQETNSVTFVGTKRSLQNVESLLEKFDTQDQQQRIHQQFFIYKPKYRKSKDIKESLAEMSNYLKSQDMIDHQMLSMIESTKLIQDTGSLLFTGNQQTYTQVEALLQNIDTPPGQNAISALGTSNYLIYPIGSAQETHLMSALKELAKKLESAPTPDSDLIFVLQHPEYIKQTHSLVFVGDEITLKEVSEIMAKLDVTQEGQSLTNFILYAPQYLEPQEILDDLTTISSQLSNSGLNDQTLILTLNSGTYSKRTGAIIFTGTKDSIEKTQNILKSIDIPDSSVGQHLFIYKPQNLSPKQLFAALQTAVKQLDGTSEYQLNTTIKNAKIIVGSLSFKGSETSIHHIQEMIKSLDTISSPGSKEQIFIYTPQYISINQLNDNLERLADKLEQDPSSSGLLNVIKDSYVEKKSQAIVFRGPSQILDQLKVLLQDLDKLSTQEETVFVYTLQNVSIKDAEYYLHTVEDHLRESTNPDLALLEVIESAKAIPQSNSLMFTGKTVALGQLKDLLAKYDSPDNAASPKQSQSAFIMYTPKYISGNLLITNLKKTAKEFQESGLANPYLIKSLQTARYNKDSNSVIVTGNEATLKDVKNLIAHFDTTQAGKPSVNKGDYLVYHPKYVSGEMLESWLSESTQNLEKSGLSDTKLIEALKSMHYNKDTSTLTFSGDPQSLAKVQELINDYDNETNAKDGPGAIVPQEGLTFLVYKLQYHQGNEIINALSTIGIDLRKYQKETQNDTIVNAISSVQWLKITNSLLLSGSTTTLEKLKGLIRKLDVPLQQVYLEVLIIRTNVTDALNFGLRWGAAGTILNKFSTAFGLFPDTPDGTFTNLKKFGNEILTAGKAVPAPTTVGANGFDLGVIGDIIFHKGKSFLTLGALAAALQTNKNDASLQTHKIIAQDNQQAHIFSGFNRPFDLSTFTQTISTGGTNQTATNEYRDVGFDLQITPIIGGNDVITLIIDQQFTESTSAELNTLQSAVVSKQTTTTRVRAPNNHFIALSGALTDTRVRSKTGIPCLGGLPVVGALFSDVSKTNTKDNIIIFIRPQLVTSDQQVIDMTERQEDNFRESAGSLELQYDIDDAINMMVPIDELE